MRGRALGIAQGSNASRGYCTAKARPRQAFGGAAALVAIAAALWSPLVISACCHPTRIDRPILIKPPSCLTRPAPVVPEGVEPFSAAWATYYVDLSAWVVETETSCADRSNPIGSRANAPIESPRWWTTATGTAGAQ